MRAFKRLFPVLALVLLTAVASAKPAGQVQTSQVPGIVAVQPQVYSGLGNPINPKLYFGTVVRDTADDGNVGVHRGGLPSVLQPREPQYASSWLCFIAQGWISLLLVPR